MVMLRDSGVLRVGVVWCCVFEGVWGLIMDGYDLHWTATVHHDGSSRYVVADAQALGLSLTLRVRTGLDVPLERLFVRTCPDGEQHLTLMHAAGESAVCRWWEATIVVAMPRTSYRFLLLTDEGSWWLTAAGMVRYTPTDAVDFKYLARPQSPSWIQDAVFYQIFPDRFSDGVSDNNVRRGERRADGVVGVPRVWGTLPNRATGSHEFFGGDLQGIVQRLDYIADLGVSALYVNPIFCAPSNHKYDVSDYTQVDPHFGGDEALIALRQALDARGMRLILDIAPNHCGATNAWFLEAQEDLAAPTAEFFTFYQHPDDYAAWLGVRSLPKLNYRSERLRERMYAGADSIMRYWLRPPYRIDGWRIDVANMLARQGESQLGHKIGRGIRRAIKAENPDAYILGEHFFDGTPQLQGDELDGVMNYRGFLLPLRQWLIGVEQNVSEGGAPRHLLPTAALAEQWRGFLASVPWRIAVQQFNLLGSHDTPRFLTIVDGDSVRAQVAVVLLFTYPGVPSVYYGDEIGMLGGSDPDCRRCMSWDSATWNGDMRALYRQLAHLRRRSPALIAGGFQLLYAAGETLAFQRESEGERLIVVARRAEDRLAELPVRHAGLADGVQLRDVLSGVEVFVVDGRVPLVGLGAIGAQIWRVVGEAGAEPC